MDDWISADWLSVLESHGLANFESIWNMSSQRVDEPNRGRGGWSEVCRYSLDGVEAPARTLYIKRQENYTSRSRRNPLTALPTFEWEYKNLVRCRQHGVPVVEPVVFMKNNAGQAILITAGLDDYIPLSSLEVETSFSGEVRRAVSIQVAELIAGLHERGLQHGSLYSKHIYVSKSLLEGDVGDCRLIDLEKTRPLLFGRFGVFRDLDSLNRHATGWSREERLGFLEKYLGNKGAQFEKLSRRLDRSRRSWIRK